MRINFKPKAHWHIPGGVCGKWPKKRGSKLGGVFPLGQQNQRQTLEIEIENGKRLAAITDSGSVILGSAEAEVIIVANKT